jgi:glucose-6-phosphate dehydrogenase assembly protein OpcA
MASGLMGSQTMIGLWDTTGNALVKALAAERRSAGGVTSGLALTLIAIVDEREIRVAESAVTIATQAHPCRLLLVVRYDVTDQRSRLDAEVIVGGRLGPCEAVVMRMRGRLALHAESVVMPLLAPDVPVVTWWQCDPPEKIAYDPLGVVADRRITDVAKAGDPLAQLQVRADDYAPGDTDLAWTRLTPLRTLLAGALDTVHEGTTIAGANIAAPPRDPSAALLAGWLKARLGVTATVEEAPGQHISAVGLTLSDGGRFELARENGHARMRRPGLPERVMPLGVRPLGDELAEELRRLDPDQPYSAALAAATGRTGLDTRQPTRQHVWKDPGLAERPDEANAASDAGAPPS